jgi:hypothetical protein
MAGKEKAANLPSLWLLLLKLRGRRSTLMNVGMELLSECRIFIGQPVPTSRASGIRRHGR